MTSLIEGHGDLSCDIGSIQVLLVHSKFDDSFATVGPSHGESTYSITGTFSGMIRLLVQIMVSR